MEQGNPNDCFPMSSNNIIYYVCVTVHIIKDILGSFVNSWAWYDINNIVYHQSGCYNVQYI